MTPLAAAVRPFFIVHSLVEEEARYFQSFVRGREPQVFYQPLVAIGVDSGVEAIHFDLVLLLRALEGEEGDSVRNRINPGRHETGCVPGREKIQRIPGQLGQRSRIAVRLKPLLPVYPANDAQDVAE